VDSISEQVEQVEKAKTKDITAKEDVMGTKDITRIVPKFEEVTRQ
jgi:hypothetical protein